MEKTVEVSIPLTLFSPEADYRNLLNQINQMPNKNT
jgi:hypothetical protein